PRRRGRRHAAPDPGALRFPGAHSHGRSGGVPQCLGGRGGCLVRGSPAAYGLTCTAPNAYPSRSFSPADRHHSLPHRSQREAYTVGSLQCGIMKSCSWFIRTRASKFLRWSIVTKACSVPVAAKSIVSRIGVGGS